MVCNAPAVRFWSSSLICLFSPQVYIDTNRTANMTLDRSGLQLTLKCGTSLHFPISLSNNLPFMLTQNSLDKGRKPQKESSLKMLTLECKPKRQSCLKMSTFGSGLYSSRDTIYNNLVEHSVFERPNQSLNSAQQELMKWNFQWSHVNLERVQMILAKPH